MLAVCILLVAPLVIGLTAMVVTLLLISRFGRSSRDGASATFEGPGQ